MITWLNGKVIDKKLWSDDLISLKIQTSPLDFKPGQFVIIGLQHGDTIIHRPYSLVNTPSDSHLEIHFNTVSDGELSPLLTRIEVGDAILISNRPSGLLTLEETPQMPELWLLATGTGVGPFLALLRTKETWHRFEKIILAYSSKYLVDMAYKAEFEALQLAHADKFTFIPFITREKVSGTIHSRITNFIESGELEQLSRTALSAEKSHVMLCGNSNMLDEATQLLENKGLRRHSRREAGNIAIEKYY